MRARGWDADREVADPRIDESGALQAVALDPFGVGAIVDALYEIGIGGQERVVGITQGWKLSGAIKTAERKLADRTLRHGGQALMSWAVGNARVYGASTRARVSRHARTAGRLAVSRPHAFGL
jgi:phage terminase large subunit-like protein